MTAESLAWTGLEYSFSFVIWERWERMKKKKKKREKKKW